MSLPEELPQSGEKRMSVSEQKKYLKENLVVVPLRGKNEEQNRINLEKIKTFRGKHNSASTLEKYLKYRAWDADVSGEKKFFLVMDAQKQQIAAYFGIRCGELYFPGEAAASVEPYLDLLADTLAKAKMIDHYHGEKENKNGYTSQVEEYLENMLEPDDRDTVRRIGQDRFFSQLDKISTEEVTSSMVSSVFPGIEITHLCVSSDFKLQEKTDIRLSVYIFWEMIVPKVLRIADQLGVQYLYLFAAEQNPDDPRHTQIFPDRQSAEMAAELTNQDGRENHTQNQKQKQAQNPERRLNKNGIILQNEERKKNRLIRLYREDMGFDFPDHMHVHKQKYDRACFTMYQTVADLPEKRKRFWSLHNQER